MIEYDTRYWNNNLTTNNNNSMDFLGIGQAIGGIAGAIGTYAASKQNRKAQEDTNKANLELARQQNDWNVQQWEREMDWNSPANKLKLLEEAGLNPVWYGANLGPTETQAPKSADLANQVAPQLDAAAIGSSLSNFSSSLVSAGQYYLTKNAQKLEEARIQNEKDRIALERARLGMDSGMTQQNIIESQKRVEEMDAKIAQIAHQNNWTDQQIEESKANVRMIDKRIDEITQNIEVLKSQIEVNKSTRARNFAEAGYFKVSAKRIMKMCPLEMENLKHLTNLSQAQYATEIEKMYNFMMNTNLQEAEIQLTKEKSIYVKRQADGQILINELLNEDVNYADDLRYMQIFTGYLNGVNGTVNAVSNAAGTANGWFGPQGQMWNSIGQYNQWQMRPSHANPIGFTNYGDYQYNVTR